MKKSDQFPETSETPLEMPLRTRYVDQGINSTMTRMQHTKSGSCAVSPLAFSTQILLTCSAQNIARVRFVVCHTRFICVSLSKN